jgi:aminoglycoside phosphotransferase (APT) family kinase protein
LDDSEVAGRLLHWLRDELACPALDYLEPPSRFAWGVDATLYAFTLQGAPPAYRGRLVLRLFPPDVPPERARREAAVQRAVSGLGYTAPNAPCHGVLGESPPRSFFVMTRLDGGTFIGFIMAVCGLAAVGSLFGWHGGWAVVLALYVGVMVTWLRRLHTLPADRFVAALEREGLGARALQPAGRLESFERQAGAITAAGLQPGLAWLREHLPTTGETVICHGDFWPGNLIVGRRGVSGVIDWGDAALAPREYELAWPHVAFYSGIPMPGPPWLAGPATDLTRPFVWAVLMTYRVSYGALYRLDRGRMRYFVAFHCLRALLFAAERRALAQTAPEIFGSRHPWTLPQVVELLERRFRRLTGVAVSI